ncbi:low affinity iron permease family protein [Nocardia sp. NPDC052566]|uniref:low affinity iron permease family protein n=1 Tax=Nocardia sp. NPDC052566 TaxID=3364330 RepID=UPI0037C99FBB
MVSPCSRGRSEYVRYVLLWLPTGLILPTVDTWQLVIDTVTTIITFLLVALPPQYRDRGR